MKTTARNRPWVIRLSAGLLIGLGAISLIALMSTSVSDAIMRALNLPFVGAKELSEAFLVCCVAISLPISVYCGKAVAIEGIVAMMPDRACRIITASGQLLGFALCAMLSYVLIQAGADARDFAEQTTLLGIPYQLFYLVLTGGFALTAVAFLIRAGISYRTINEIGRE